MHDTLLQVNMEKKEKKIKTRSGCLIVNHSCACVAYQDLLREGIDDDNQESSLLIGQGRPPGCRSVEYKIVIG